LKITARVVARIRQPLAHCRVATVPGSGVVFIAGATPAGPSEAGGGLWRWSPSTPPIRLRNDLRRWRFGVSLYGGSNHDEMIVLWGGAPTTMGARAALDSGLDTALVLSTDNGITIEEPKWLSTAVLEPIVEQLPNGRAIVLGGLSPYHEIPQRTMTSFVDGEPRRSIQLPQPHGYFGDAARIGSRLHANQNVTGPAGVDLGVPYLERRRDGDSRGFAVGLDDIFGATEIPPHRGSALAQESSTSYLRFGGATYGHRETRLWRVGVGGAVALGDVIDEDGKPLCLQDAAAYHQERRLWLFGGFRHTTEFAPNGAPIMGGAPSDVIYQLDVPAEE